MGGLGGLIKGVGGGFGGLGMLGMLGGDQGKGANLKALLQEMEQKLALAHTKSTGYQLHGLDELSSGYNKAIENVGRVGSANTLMAQSAGAQAQGQVAQSMASRGLGNTTAASQASTSAMGQTQRTLASINSSVASAKANLEAARGQAMGGAWQGLSSLEQGYGQQQMNPLGMAYESVSNAPTLADRMMQLLSAGGNIAGLAMGARH
jgi:hypothetical protein